jgi:ABC-type Zn2+ transport system substrate-binding protein/surface adhesin
VLQRTPRLQKHCKQQQHHHHHQQQQQQHHHHHHHQLHTAQQPQQARQVATKPHARQRGQQANARQRQQQMAMLVVSASVQGREKAPKAALCRARRQQLQKALTVQLL